MQAMQAGLCTGQWPPTLTDIDALQQHIHELELWKYHAEASMRLLQQGPEFRAAVAAAAVAAAAGIGGPAGAAGGPAAAAMAAAAAAAALTLGAWPLPALDEAACTALEGVALASTTATSSPRSCSPAATPLAQLTGLPMRLHLGPEPSKKQPGAPTKHRRGGSNDSSGTGKDEPSFPSLLPPGLMFSMAASLNAGAGAEDTASGPKDLEASPKASPQGGRPPAPPGLAPGADRVGKAAASAACLPEPLKVDLQPSEPLTEVTPGVFTGNIDVAGLPCARAEWRIDSVRAKLQASMGRPLVSPPFSARGLPNLRLMVLPDPREAVKNARNRERKSVYTAMVKKGPLNGSLKLKADCLEHDKVLSFFLTVGAVRRGPFTYDFAECAIHGCDDFNTDWLKQVDETDGSLAVGVEIFEAKVAEALGSAGGGGNGSCGAGLSGWPLGSALADPAEMYRIALAAAKERGSAQRRSQQG